jgi:hypothetical protein
MSDQPAQPTKPEPTDEPETAKGGAALPKHQQMTVTQHVFIWTMVVVVGVLFGAGSYAPMVGRAPKIGNVDEGDIMLRQATARKLQAIINPGYSYGGENFEPSPNDRRRQADPREIWAGRIKMARYAESLGLMPGGAALDAIVKEFLGKPLPGGSNRRYVDALQDHRDGDKAVTAEELKRFLAERRAIELLNVQHVVVPAVPQAMADAVVALGPLGREDYYMGVKGDEVALDEVVLEGKHLLPKVPDDDPEILTTYEKLRGQRFTRPAACVVTMAYADTKALAEKVVVGDAEIQAYYDAHKDEFRKPAEPPKAEEKKDADKIEIPKLPEPPKVEYKALADVSAEIKAKLAKEAADKQAKQLVQAFDQSAQELEGQKDGAGFKAAAAKAGLAVKEGVEIVEPQSGGTLAAGEFGDLNESQIKLFAQEPGFISSTVHSEGANAAWLVLRLDSRRPSGYRDLKDPEVRAAVIASLAGQRAYKDLLKAAEEARAAAEKLGAGGLKKWAESDAAKTWEAKLTSRTANGLQPLAAPRPEVNGQPGEPRLVASLAMPEHPVVLTEAQADAGEAPKLKLVQATAYKAVPPPVGQARVERANRYRELLEGYRDELFNRQLGDKLRN